MLKSTIRTSNILINHNKTWSGSGEEGGVFYGPELIVDGGFDSGKDFWSGQGDGALTVTDGIAKIEQYFAISPYAFQTPALPGIEEGKTYRLVFDLVTNSNNHDVVFGTMTNTYVLVNTETLVAPTPDTYEYIFVAGATDEIIFIQLVSPATSQYIEFDNVSLKQII